MTTLGGFGGDSCRAYRALFYEEKLKIVLNTEKGSNELRHLCRTYLEGLQWVAYYYFRGPDASGWRWYYSYHYAPFMRDVLECDVFKPSFQDTQRMISTGKGAHAQRLDLSYLIERTISLPKGEPYSPFMQLLSILPPQSAALLPPQLRHLLTNPPPELQPFFPNDFEIDMEGVKVPWGGVTLLPFVDESVLERIALPLVEKLPPELLKRNETGRVVLLMREKNEHSWRQHGLLLIDKHSDTYKLGQLASIDPVYEQECFFFKNKIINRSLGVALDIPSLVNRINGSMQEGIPSGNGQHQVFVSSLPWAFPDVVDSCVVEEEVLVLPPLVADRLEAFKVLGVLRILNLKDQVLSPFSYSTARDAVASYVETLRSALQSTDFSSMGPRSGPPVKLQPLPKLHPKDDEFLFPTTPLPGASPAAAVLTPSLFSKCISWHRGTGVKVFKRISSSQSIVLSVMPFSREELHRGSACSIVSLLKPTETLNELLSSRFVLFDYPFVKLASPVAVWHPTFYLPLDFRSTAKCADIPSDPMEQLQEVETEKRRLRAQGIHVADETEAFHFFTQHTAKARTEKIAERQQNSASYWDPEEQVLCGSDKERNLGCAPVQSLEQQLQRLALDVTSALPGTEQQQLSRSYHPDTALSTLLVELRPVEDIVMAEKLVDLQSTSSSSGNPTSSKPFEKKPTACVHFRYGSETVFRLLPLLSTPSSSLLESMQQCHQDVIDAVEAHRKVRWKAGDDVFCIASDRQQQLRPGLTGVLEKDPTSEDSHVLVRVSSWREEPIGFQADLDDACSAICAASSDCGLHIAIFTKETGKPAYVVRFSLPWPNHGSRDLQQSQCRSHLFTSNAVELGKKIVRAFPALGNILDSVGGNGRSIMMNCHLKAADVFRGLPDPAFLASRLASMAAQSPSRRAKAVTKEYAWLPNSMYSALDAERGSRSAGLPDPRAVVLPANVVNCVPAADLLTIQKHIVSKFLVLRKVQQGEDGECRFVYTVKAHLGQRVAYARFRGSVPQGAHGTACGFASKFGGCNIKCSYINDGAERTGATRSPNPQASRGAGSRPLPFARGGAYVDSAVIGLAIRRQLNFRGLSSEKHGQQHEAKIHGWKDAGLILSQISAAERVSLFQKQLAFLEDLCIEVLLDEPCLGASDGNGSIETLRILLCPASHWLPICSEVSEAATA
ncbi:hypothetical protein EMWEY_00020570 [Eimeria maxima]|uniref:Xrn1 helical domain-containing protein n=1 Tax=Eimeria maxima TaxID=5804 RepID=U6M5B7_EIMMA|nr:hypothetical protein EMWEY_00020570 [Eimeria maxima]CDJ59216.1 hypothetical protein EMWEY_00020570 [Eimeria maxima]